MSDTTVFVKLNTGMPEHLAALVQHERYAQPTVPDWAPGMEHDRKALLREAIEALAVALDQDAAARRRRRANAKDG